VVRENRIKDITNHILLPFDEKYNAIGKFILQTAQNIVDEANREYLLHAELIDKWPQIVIKAKILILWISFSFLMRLDKLFYNENYSC